MSLTDVDYTQIPAGDPPDNVDPNFIDPPSRAWQPRLAVYITLPIAVLSIFLRVYTRIHRAHRFQAEDYFIFAAGLGAVGYTAVILSNTDDDVIGRHFWDIPVSAMMTPTIPQESFVIAVINLFAHFSMKISLCLLYRRLFYPSKTNKYMVWSGIIFIAISYPALLIAWTYLSVPHAGDGGWMSTPFAERVTKTSSSLAVSISVVNSFTDFYLLAIPLTSVSALNMSTGRKVAISALFLTGLLTCGLSVAGVVARVRLHLSSPSDPFWSTMTAYAFSVVEVNVGLVCASMPVVFSTLRSAALRSRSLLDSWKTSLFSNSTGPNPTSDSGKTAGPEVERGNAQELPSIPKGALHTLVSLFRDGRHSRTAATANADDVEMPAYSELRSVDIEYHRNMVK